MGSGRGQEDITKKLVAFLKGVGLPMLFIRGWFRIPHHAPGRLFEGVSCPSASGRDLTLVKNQILQLRNWGVQ
jgi:hypothetical protein